MTSRKYATGLTLMVIAACSHGPLWLDLVVGALGVWMVLTDKEVRSG